MKNIPIELQRRANFLLDLWISYLEHTRVTVKGPIETFRREINTNFNEQPDSNVPFDPNVTFDLRNWFVSLHITPTAQIYRQQYFYVSDSLRNFGDTFSDPNTEAAISLEIRKAYLLAGTYEGVMGLYFLIEKLFKDLGFTISETEFTHRIPNLLVNFIVKPFDDSNWMFLRRPLRHTIIRLKSLDESLDYALDITSAQYGHRLVIEEWAKYKMRWVDGSTDSKSIVEKELNAVRLMTAIPDLATQPWIPHPDEDDPQVPHQWEVAWMVQALANFSDRGLEIGYELSYQRYDKAVEKAVQNVETEVEKHGYHRLFGYIYR